jgi:hypothetical protein
MTIHCQHDTFQHKFFLYSLSISRKLDKQVATYCESEIRDAIQNSGAYDQNACEKWEVEIEPDQVQPLLEAQKMVSTVHFEEHVW